MGLAELHVGRGRCAVLSKMALFATLNVVSHVASVRREHRTYSPTVADLLGLCNEALLAGSGVLSPASSTSSAPPIVTLLRFQVVARCGTR